MCDASSRAMLILGTIYVQLEVFFDQQYLDLQGFIVYICVMSKSDGFALLHGLILVMWGLEASVLLSELEIVGHSLLGTK